MTLIPALMCVLEMRVCNFTFTPIVHLSINFKLKGLGRRGAFDLFFSTHVISLRVWRSMCHIHSCTNLKGTYYKFAPKWPKMQGFHQIWAIWGGKFDKIQMPASVGSDSQPGNYTGLLNCKGFSLEKYLQDGSLDSHFNFLRKFHLLINFFKSHQKPQS